MITKEEIKSGKAKQTLKIILSGQTGTGKTRTLFTFPKVAYLGTEPNGLDTARSNPDLLENLVWADEFITSVSEDIKATFDRLDKGIEMAHQDQAKGEVETLGLDNFTFLAQNRWIYINKYERCVSKNGELDTRGMYGTLGRWLYKFFLEYIVSFPGNVVVTCHEQTESDEAMERKTDKTLTVSPAILGGFRNEIGGLFSAFLYMECRRKGENQYEFWARCRKGNQREAKNRYNLPELVQNVSYKAIMESIGKGVNNGVVPIQTQGGK